MNFAALISSGFHHNLLSGVALLAQLLELLIDRNAQLLVARFSEVGSKAQTDNYQINN